MVLLCDRCSYSSSTWSSASRCVDQLRKLVSCCDSCASAGSDPGCSTNLQRRVAKPTRRHNNDAATERTAASFLVSLAQLCLRVLDVHNQREHALRKPQKMAASCTPSWRDFAASSGLEVVPARVHSTAESIPQAVSWGMSCSKLPNSPQLDSQHLIARNYEILHFAAMSCLELNMCFIVPLTA